MLADVLADRCRAKWDDWFGERAPARIDLSFVASRARSDERAVALVFVDRRLRAALKLAVGMRPGLQREHEVLRYLARHSNLKGSVPQVLGTGYEQVGFRAAGHEVPEPLWMLPLHPLGGSIWRPPDPGRAISAREFADVERILRELDGLTAQIGDDGAPPEVLPLGVNWRTGVRLLSVDKHHRFQLEAHYPEMPASREPTRWAHGDLAPGNVRVSSSKVAALLDWEMFDPAYEPWFDGLYPALLALSSVLLQRVCPPAASWPIRWLRVLASESGSVPIQVRCLRVTAELASRSAQLHRGSIERWRYLAHYLEEGTEIGGVPSSVQQ